MNDRRRSRGVASFEELEVGGAALERANESPMAIELGDADADADADVEVLLLLLLLLL